MINVLREWLGDVGYAVKGLAHAIAGVPMRRRRQARLAKGGDVKIVDMMWAAKKKVHEEADYAELLASLMEKQGMTPQKAAELYFRHQMGN